jgi:hypothetical protein
MYWLQKFDEVQTHKLNTSGEEVRTVLHRRRPGVSQKTWGETSLTVPSNQLDIRAIPFPNTGPEICEYTNLVSKNRSISPLSHTDAAELVSVMAH